jgi:hypothetical protein
MPWVELFLRFIHRQVIICPSLLALSHFPQLIPFNSQTSIPGIMSRAAGWRVFWLRALVMVSLRVAAVVGEEVYAYDSVSVALKNTQVSFARSAKACILLATIYSIALPTESDWPNAHINGFVETAGQLAGVSGIKNFAFSPVLQPVQATAWEAFAFNMWDSDPLIPPGRAFVSRTDRGIWNFDPSIPFPGSIYLDDQSGNTSWGNTLRYMLPKAQDLDPAVLGRNVFQDASLGPLAQAALVCAMNTSLDISAARSECTAVLPPQSLPLPNPFDPSPSTTGYQTIILSPIAIVGDDGDTKAVGIVTAALDWSTLLNDSISFVEDMDVVVEAEGVLGIAPVTFTFGFKNGALVFKGQGDLHDANSIINKGGEVYLPSVGNAESSSYTISFSQPSAPTSQPSSAPSKTLSTSDDVGDGAAIAGGVAAGTIILYIILNMY